MFYSRCPSNALTVVSPVLGNPRVRVYPYSDARYTKLFTNDQTMYPHINHFQDTRSIRVHSKVFENERACPKTRSIYIRYTPGIGIYASQLTHDRQHEFMHARLISMVQRAERSVPRDAIKRDVYLLLGATAWKRNTPACV